MPIVSRDDVLAKLERLEILSGSQIHRARKWEFDASEMIHALAALGLTSYQVDAIRQGQPERLVLGQYILLRRLAEGGMGTVYQARHRRLDRVVALKVIRSDKLKSRTIAKRFLREIRLTASLEHPHIVKAFDAGTVGDTIYLATEFITGSDLASFVRTYGPMPVHEACRAIRDAALGLQHIHENRMVHRDIKPSNLIRDDRTGEVKLLDLGLCSLPEDSATFDSKSGTLTRNGMLLGTPDYLSPEQAQTPHDVDIRADLYSLGCTFQFLLTGNPPFPQGSALDKVMKHLYDAPPAPIPPQGELPRGIRILIETLLRKNPEDRFATPVEVVERLNSHLSRTILSHAEENPFAFITSSPQDSAETATERTQELELQQSREWLWLMGALGTLLLSLILIIGSVVGR